MKMKKVILAICAVAVALSSFSGCGEKKGGNDGNTLKWYVPGDSQSGTSEVLSEANKISMEKIGANLDLQFIDEGAFTEKMQLNMASSDKFDLCFTGYVNNFHNAVQNGGLAPIDEYLDKFPTLKNSIQEELWNAVKVNGKIYAVPNVQIYAFGIHAFTFKDLAEKYGLEPENVKTIQDLEPYLEKIKANEPGMYPARFEMAEDGFSAATNREIVTNLVCAMINNDGSVTMTSKFDQDYYKDVLDDMHSWYKKGYFRKDLASATDDSMDADAGKYAVWFHNNAPNSIDLYTERYDREVIAIQLENYKTKGNAIRAALTAVGQNSQNKEKAVALIDLLNNDKDYFNLICFGFEGKHYTKIEDNRAEYIENADYAPKADWKFGNQFNAYVTGDQPDDVWEQTKKLNDESEKSPIIDFAFDTNNVQAEISQCENIINEYLPALKGTVPREEYYDELISRLKTAGAEKIVEEAQKQYESRRK